MPYRDRLTINGLREALDNPPPPEGTVKLRYLRRLGDVCQLLAPAKALHDKGKRVFIECDCQYADILKAASFVTHSHPHAPEPCEVEYNLGIHAKGGGSDARYHAYRRSGKTWQQFVIDSVPELAGTGGPPPFDTLHWFSPEAYDLPADGNYAIVVPGGYSQITKHDPARVVQLAKRLFPEVPLVCLTDRPSHKPGMLYVRRLRDMPGLLAHAKHLLTINTSTSIIGAGVRDSFHFIPQTGNAALDNAEFGKGIYVSI
jgi:hypothetical protein